MSRIDLQFHPFINGGYGVSEVLSAMEKREIDVLGCLEYSWQEEVTLAVIKGMDKEKVEKNYTIDVDGNVFFFTKKKTGKVLCLILGQEVAPVDQKWHFLSVGALGIKPREDPRDVMGEILDKDGLLIFDHPFADPGNYFSRISRTKEEELFLLCEQYQGRIALEWNGYCLPWLRALLFYGDVNKKTEVLGQRLNIPIVPTTDVHAVNRNALGAMGTCFIEVPNGGMNYGNILQSLKKNIFSFNFKEKKDYVSFGHFLKAFAVPYIKSKLAAG